MTASPSTPLDRSVDRPARLFGWLARQRVPMLALSLVFGIAWVVCQATWPVLLGNAVDAAADGFGAHLVLPLLALAALVVAQSTAGILNYRTSYTNYLHASLRLARLVGVQLNRAGRALEQETSAGEVVVSATTDASRVGRIFDILPRLVGAVLAWVGVTITLFASSTELGVLAAVSVPVACAALALLVRPLESKQGEQRGKLGVLTSLGSDAAAGLRVLRGIGGEEEFVARYRRQSGDVRSAGLRLAKVQAWLGSAQVFLPGLVVAVVVIYGAGLVLDDRWTAGELVTAYGFSAFLALPISIGVEAIATFTGAAVSARRILDVLRVEPIVAEPDSPAPAPTATEPLVDVASGLVVRPGVLTAVVGADPDSAAELVRRLGRYDDRDAEQKPVLWAGTPLTALPVREVRRRVMVAEPVAHLFSGTLLEGLDPLWTGNGDAATRTERVMAAVRTAAAEDVLAARAEGLAEHVNERGRAFSGGERQRLSLARALLVDPEVLVLIEPTSAVDARTEQLIADRVAAVRRGRTTVVVTESPLLLLHAEEIAVLEDGRVAVQAHPDELQRSAAPAARLFRSIVRRAEGEVEDAAPDR